MMNAAKGWGSSQQPGSNQGVIQQQVNQQQQQQQWQGMTNSADYEAYLKWWAENQRRQQEQQKEMEKQRIEAEAKERQENMMAQWKQWEHKMQMSSNFESLGIEIMEMKHRYYSLVVMEFLKFCKCTDARAVAQAVMGLSAQEKVKAYFYGLATQMCEGANDYFDQVEAWEKQYNFLEKLS